MASSADVALVVRPVLPVRFEIDDLEGVVIDEVSIDFQISFGRREFRKGFGSRPINLLP